MNMMVDGIMTILLFVLMGYHISGQLLHEIVGALMIVCFIAHIIMHRRWYMSLGRGKYTPARVMQTAINILLGIDVLCLALSGIAMSKYVFSFLSLPVSQSFARSVHLTAAYLGYILMSLHIGLHAGMMYRRIRGNKKLPFAIRLILGIVGAGIFIYGIYALVSRGFFGYILQTTQFAYFDYSESPILFYLDYLCIMISVAMVSHFLLVFLNYEDKC